MSEDKMSKMKELIKQKKDKGNRQNKMIPDKKIGAGKSGISNIKNGGSNNKV